jgi:hypothetical protein
MVMLSNLPTDWSLSLTTFQDLRIEIMVKYIFQIAVNYKTQFKNICDTTTTTTTRSR